MTAQRPATDTPCAPIAESAASALESGMRMEEVTFEDVVAARDGVRVQLTWIGEGLCGDYCAQDPEDEPLLRFYVQRLVDGAWQDIDDASFCTLIRAHAEREQLIGVAHEILSEVGDSVRAGVSIGKTCECLSWTGGSS